MLCVRWIFFAEKFGVGVVEAEQVSLFADQFLRCSMQREEIVQMRFVVGHFGVAEPPSE